MSFSKVICVVDDDVDVQDVGQVAWRLLANLDPKRDFAFVDGPIDQLDHGANQALWGGKVCIDGTRKWREEGYAREWPEPCRMSADVSARVDAMWPELGLGPAHGEAERQRRRTAVVAPRARTRCSPGASRQGAAMTSTPLAPIADVGARRGDEVRAPGGRARHVRAHRADLRLA